MPAVLRAEQKFLTIVLLIVGTTLLTGLFFILMGVFKLGALVRFLPYPVAGGFLAGTGWPLITGAIGLTTDAPMSLVLLEPVGQPAIRLETMRGGRVVGEIGFYLGAKRTAAVRADEPATIYRLSQARLKEMEESDPEAANTFYRLIIHLLSERVTHLTRAVDALLR